MDYLVAGWSQKTWENGNDKNKPDVASELIDSGFFCFFVFFFNRICIISISGLVFPVLST